MALIIAAGAILRLYNIDILLTNVQPWRQANTAAIARNFYENRMNLFRLQIDWAPEVGGYVESDFPF